MAPGLSNEIEHDYYSDFVKNFYNSVEVTISCRMPKSKTNLPKKANGQIGRKDEKHLSVIFGAVTFEKSIYQQGPVFFGFFRIGTAFLDPKSASFLGFPAN